MKKHWFMSILAAALVVVGGTAFASFPSGGNTTFRVEDPAVTVIASGQTPDVSGGAEACHWKAAELLFCQGEGLTFTPKVDAVCQVNADIGLVGEPMGEGGKLESVEYGLGLHYEGEDHQVDENGLTASPTYQSYATMPRSRLIAVEAGKEYSFETWTHSLAEAHGTTYWYLDYVCFG